MTPTDSDYIKSFCSHCYESFEFPCHGVGTIIECPHCKRSTRLDTPDVLLKNIYHGLIYDKNRFDKRTQFVKQAMQFLGVIQPELETLSEGLQSEIVDFIKDVRILAESTAKLRISLEQDTITFKSLMEHFDCCGLGSDDIEKEWSTSTNKEFPSMDTQVDNLVRIQLNIEKAIQKERSEPTEEQKKAMYDGVYATINVLHKLFR